MPPAPRCRRRPRRAGFDPEHSRPQSADHGSGSPTPRPGPIRPAPDGGGGRRENAPWRGWRAGPGLLVWRRRQAGGHVAATIDSAAARHHWSNWRSCGSARARPDGTRTARMAACFFSDRRPPGDVDETPRCWTCYPRRQPGSPLVERTSLFNRPYFLAPAGQAVVELRGSTAGRLSEGRRPARPAALTNPEIRSRRGPQFPGTLRA